MKDTPVARLAASLLGSLVDFIFPPFCAACHRRLAGSERGAICEGCWQLVDHWPPGACQRCGAALEPEAKPRLCPNCRIDQWPCSDARAVGPFSGTVAEAIHLLKYSDHRNVARRLAGMMSESIGGDPGYRSADLVLAVPLHPARRRERGFNQAQLLADGLSRQLAIPTDEVAVARKRNTGTQTRLNRQERLENVKEIFKVNKPALVQGRTIILIDDVLTTGATIGSCGRSLLAAGASEVLALTAAAAPLS
jgi:ComF family protein